MTAAAEHQPATSVAEAIARLGLSDAAVDMLQAVRGGADIWEYPDAVACRALERLGLVLIGPAERAPAHGAMRQPYFGCIISAEGKVVLQRALKARRDARKASLA